MTGSKTKLPPGGQGGRMEQEEEMKEFIEKPEVKDPYAPPDGGWGWVVMIASFLCNLVLDGIAYVFGIFLAPMMEDFQVRKGPMSTVGSILAGTIQLAGPFVAILVERYGTRKVCILGALVSSVSFFLSTFCSNIYLLMIVYGFMAGCGLGLMYIPAQVAVGYYFEKRRSLATGIITCGSGAGAFLLAPLASSLLLYYGGTWQGPTRVFAGLCLQCAACGMLMRPLPKRPVEKVDLDTEGGGAQEGQESNCLMSVFRSACSPRLMTNPSFILLCLCNLCATQGLYIPYVYLPGLAESKGISVASSSFLISILGLSNTVARILTGALADLPCVNALVVTTVALGLGGVSCLLMIACTPYWSFVLVSVMFGVCIAAWCAVTAPSLVDILGLDLLTYAFGTLTFVRGIAALVGPPLAGFIVDATGEADYSFYIAAGLLMASSVFCGLAYLVERLGHTAPIKDL